MWNVSFSAVVCLQLNAVPGSVQLSSKVELATSANISVIPKAFQLPEDQDKFLDYVSICGWPYV